MRNLTRLTSGVVLVGSALLIFTSCGARRLPGFPKVDEVTVEEELDQNASRRSLEATVLELYAQLTLSNQDAYLDAFAPRRSISVQGVVSDFFDVSKDKLPDPRFFRSKQPTLLAKSLAVHPIAGTKMGWTFDELSYRVQHQGRTAPAAIRRTGVYVRRKGRWFLVGEHWSYPLSPNLVSRYFESNSLASVLLPPKNGETVPAAADIEKQIKRLHSESGSIRGTLRTDSAETIFVSLGLEGEYAGLPPRVARMFGPNTTVDVTGLRTHVDPSGRAAWATSVLELRRTLAQPKKPLRLRALYVLTKDTEGPWRFDHLHLSVPVTELQLRDLILGIDRREP